MKTLCILPTVFLLAYAQDSALVDIENKSKKGNFEETLEIRDVRESSAKDVGEALSKVDGVWKIRRGGIANDVVLRGFQRDNLNVLVDGIRIFGACPNRMDPPAFHVDFAEIQEVDVAKGAFDMRNQGSLGGVVNIVSKSPAGGFRVTPTFAAGSFGFFNPSVAGSYLNDRFYASAGHSYRRSKPYRDGAGKRFTEYANYRAGSMDADAFGVNTAWSRFGFAPRPNHRAEFAYTRQGGDEVLYPYLLMDAVYDNADRASVSYTIAGLQPVKALRVHAYYTRVKHWMTDERRASSVGAPRSYGMATFAATKALGAKVESEFENLVLGFETYDRNWNALNTMRMAGAYTDQHSIPNVGVRTAGAYAQYTRTFAERLTLTGGARLDVAAARARASVLVADLFWAYKGTRSVSATDTNPSASFQAGYRLPRGIELFAGVGRTARVPDPQERYFALKRMGTDWVGNPGLRPVRNTEADLGIAFRSRRVYVRPTLFYSRLTDYIAVHDAPRLNMAPGIMNTAARSYENVNAHMYGGELTYNVGLTRQLLLFGGASYTRGTKDIVPALRTLDSNMPEIPPLKTRAAVRYGTRLFFAEVEGIVSAAQDRVDAGLKESRTAGYGVMNAKTGVHTKRINVAVGVDNLLDRYYYEAYSYQRDPYRLGIKVPEPGRSLYVSAAYSF
jgi:iron complex outermembrane receptor protein